MTYISLYIKIHYIRLHSTKNFVSTCDVSSFPHLLSHSNPHGLSYNLLSLPRRHIYRRHALPAPATLLQHRAPPHPHLLLRLRLLAVFFFCPNCGQHRAPHIHVAACSAFVGWCSSVRIAARSPSTAPAPSVAKPRPFCSPPGRRNKPLQQPNYLISVVVECN